MPGTALKSTEFYNRPRISNNLKKIDDKFDKLASLYNKTHIEHKFININRASEHELQKLFGIGPKLSKRIVEYRKKNGKFIEIIEIMKVKGIGESKFNKIKNIITVKE